MADGRLALAAALHERGALREAGALVEQGLSARREAGESALDPWWLYPRARDGQVRQAIAQLVGAAVGP